MQPREQAILDRILETCTVGVFVKGRDGRIQYANPHAEKVLGLTKDRDGRMRYRDPPWRIVDRDGRPLPEEEQPLRRVMSAGRPVRDMHCDIEWPNGVRKSLALNGAPVLDDSGNVTDVIFFVEDDSACGQSWGDTQGAMGRTTKRGRRLRWDKGNVHPGTDAAMTPGVDTVDLELADVIDVPKIQALMEDFTKLTRMTTAILDLRGKVVVATGWQDICTKFHRANEASARFCTESDLYLARNMRQGEHVAYRCRNNMWDLVTPLFVGDRHIGNVYTGQFFYDDEEIDEEAFAAQADRYGFDKEAYMEALRKVPRYSRETVDTMTDYLVTLTSCVSSFGYSYISLARMMAEKEHIWEELRMRKTMAEEAVLKAQTYLDFIGHDLTNILSPVMTRAEMISQDEHVEPWVRDNASSIVRQIERATSFVRNTRRLSDSDRNEQKRTEAADLAQVLEEAQGNVITRYPGKRPVFRIEFPPGGPACAAGRDFIATMVEELLDNAVKHAGSDDVKVEVSVRPASGSPQHEYWMVEVADDGPGIPDDVKKGLRAEVFAPENRFTRGIASSLCFMSLIAEHIGGRLRVEDRVPGDHTRGTKVSLLLISVPPVAGHAIPAPGLDAPAGPGTPRVTRARKVAAPRLSSRPS
jgi:PAS domain S-box-containing protein